MSEAENQEAVPPRRPEVRRLGPRPLPQHLGLAMSTWANSAAALPALSSALANLPPDPNGAAGRNQQEPDASGLLQSQRQLRQKFAELGPLIQAQEPAALMKALQDEGHRRFAELLSGIRAYRHHTSQRQVPSAPVVWDEGTTRLLDYRGSAGPAKGGSVGPRPRVLVIPSLVNRYFIVDLDRQASFLRWLAGNGFDPFVVDWDAPGYIERGFSLTEYVAGRLEAALRAVRREKGGPVFLVGYCMGGNLALALAQRRQAELAGLACLATPWDFHAENAVQARMMGQVGRQLETVLQALGELPVDMLQSFFSSLDPFQVLKKFRHFSTLDPESSAARRFVVLEDWLNDGVSLAAPVARECLGGWYGDNTPQNLNWVIDGRVVDPATLKLPVLNVIPSADRIVPPESSRAITRRLKNADELVPETGHVGMMAGRSAARDVWEPLAAWLRQRC